MTQYKFKGIDDFNRPVFKKVDGEVCIGSVDILFPNKEIAPNNTNEEITNYFKNNKDKLVLFGIKFNCEPDGTRINPDKFEII